MSFVINTTIDKTQELLDAYKDTFENDQSKDVFLICKDSKIPVNSFALALSSDFMKQLLMENQREIINIVIPEVDPDLLAKVVEYIYIGNTFIDPRKMADFIEICNLLQLKATISCERKLVFDKPVTTDAFAPSTSTALAITGSQHAASDNVDSNTTNVTRQQNLDSLIADLEETPKFNDDGDDEDSSYELKDKDIQEPNQILEVYEISNIEEDMTYEDEDMESEEHYELMNVIEPKVETSEPKSVKKKECKTDTMEYYEVSEIKPRIPAKQVDEEILNAALGEIIANTSSFRVVSEKYGIPKTLLWRRAKKIGYIKGEKQKDSNRLQAIEAIKHGESLISLSKRFNIPISTLHREKLKLFENGQLPDSVNLKNRSRGEDFDDRMRNALAEILNGKSQNEVAKKYKIPKTTLWRLLRKMAPATKPDNVLVAADSDVVTQLLTQSKKRQSIKEEIDDSDQIPLKILST